MKSIKNFVVVLLHSISLGYDYLRYRYTEYKKEKRPLG